MKRYIRGVWSSLPLCLRGDPRFKSVMDCLYRFLAQIVEHFSHKEEGKGAGPLEPTKPGEPLKEAQLLWVYCLVAQW
jgi:hypothetical protein